MKEKLFGGKLAAAAVFAFLFIAAILFVPAGTLDWAEAWVLIALFLLYFALVGGWLARNNPGLAERRASTKLPEKGWDRIIMLSLGLLMLGQIVLAGLDFRFGWSKVHPAVEAVGFAGIAFTFYVNFLVIKENAFLSRIAELQKGQKVVSTGPYAIVRHPMYAGFIPFLLGTGLALGSVYAIVPGALSIVALAARALKEDRMLQKELKGYKEYAEKVRYRLLPGIW